MGVNVKGIFFVMLFGVISCTSYKQTPYFQKKGDPEEFETQSHLDKSAIRLQADDVLSIIVNVVGEQKIALDYNLPLYPVVNSLENDDGEYVDASMGRQTYLVSGNGEIDFPNLGYIKVTSYTLEELQEYIKRLLRERMKMDPVVTVRLMNFKIIVTGEVSKPGQYTINKSRIDLFEALALAGDLTIYGMRENVTVRRQLQDGSFKYAKLDVSKADITTSPYFYLRQNDMIYVQPNKIKSMQSDISLWSTVVNMVTFLMGVVTFVTVYTQR
jgi:polysaccharide export outer membrane protein